MEFIGNLFDYFLEINWGRKDYFSCISDGIQIQSLLLEFDASTLVTTKELKQRGH